MANVNKQKEIQDKILIIIRSLKKHLFYGSGNKNSILKRAFIYALLLGIGFVYLYPLAVMVSSSLMTTSDLVNPTVKWVPTSLYFGNYSIAYKVLEGSKSILVSVFMSAIPAILQTASCAVVGYGFARFDFPLKKFWMIMLIVVFIIPMQVTIVPKYVLYSDYKMLNTPFPSFLPAMFAQGIKGSIFVLIFYQFFNTYPKVLDEAAEIDGASKLGVFFKIALPISVPAIVVSFLFSFVWYWNETYMSSILFGSVIRTLPMRLKSFADSYTAMFPTTDGSTENSINESIRMAGTLLTILPLSVMYLILQKQFVESVDKTGITGE